MQSLLIRKQKEVSHAKLQRLADQLRFIRSEKLTSIKELNELTSMTENKLKKAKQEIKKSESNSTMFKEIDKAIISYKNNKPFHDDVSRSTFKKRKQNKYEVELRTFEYSKQKLQGAGIKSDADIEQFLDRFFRM